MPESYWCITAPNIQRVWSASSLSCLSDCPRKYELAYIEGWTPKEDQLDLLFGTYWHELMELYWQARFADAARIWYHKPRHFTHDEILRELVPMALDYKLPLPTRPKQAGKTALSLARAIVWYFEQYSNDEIGSIVILQNGEPALELHFIFALDLMNPDGERYLLQGYIDSLRSFNQLRTAWDYKTTSDTSAPWYVSKFEIDLQSQIYTLAAHMLTNEKYSLFIADAMGGGVSYRDFNRISVEMTPALLEEALADVRSLIRSAERYAEQDYYPKNTGSCSFCQFNGICNKDPASRYAFLKTDFEEKRREVVEARS